jgi:hypothetical protein
VLERKGNFTTAALYKELTFTGEENREIMSIWRAKIPLKINFFCGPYILIASHQQNNW